MKQRKNIRKAVSLPVFLLCAAVLLSLAPGALAEKQIPSLDLFQAEDLDLPELSGAKRITAENGKEITISNAGVYVLGGTASQCTVTVDAGKKDMVWLVLDGLNITNTSDLSCIYVKKAQKVIITLVSENSLTQNAAGGKQRAVIHAKSDLTLNGEGSLSISSLSDGIVSKENLFITGGNCQIVAQTNALEADESVAINNGNLYLEGKDGIHVENDDSPYLGNTYIGGGNIVIHAKSDGIQTQTILQINDGDVTVEAEEGLEGTLIIINGGTIRIHSWGDGINTGNKTKAYFPALEINGGHITINMDPVEKADGIDSNGDLIIRGGVLEIYGSGVDFDAHHSFTGGTIFIDGVQVDKITNQSHHHIER